MVKLPYTSLLIYMSKANCLGTVDSKNFDTIRDLVENCSRDTLTSATSTVIGKCGYPFSSAQHKPLWRKICSSLEWAYFAAEIRICPLISLPCCDLWHVFLADLTH